MNREPNLKIKPPRPFLQQFLILIGIDTLIVLMGALILRNPVQVSNLYFISSVVFFVIAAIPILSELGSSVKLAGKAIKQGENVSPILKEKQTVYQERARTTYVYGLAGLVTFILSMLTVGLG